MNAPSLQRLTLFSLVVHLIFFAAVSLAIKGANHFVMPSPYIVSLVGTERKNAQGTPEKSEQQHEAVRNLSSHKNPNALHSKEDKHLSEVISALEAKKKIEKIVRMRDIITLKGSVEGKAAAAPGTSGKKSSSAPEDYYTHITKEIWQNWSFPDTGDKNLEAVVSIKILKDGLIQIKGIEKKSGNSLFDRSAIRAITKANPLPPPPYEMEIGVRFYP